MRNIGGCLGVDIDLLVKRYMAIRHSTLGMYNEIDRAIYYLSDLTGEQILWKAWRISSGYRHDIALPWDRRINNYRISPTGVIAFSTDMDGDERWSIYTYHENRLELVSGEDGSINNLGEWSPSGRFLSYSSNSRNGVDFDIYVYDFVKRSRSFLYKGDGIVNPSRWVNDDLLLAVKMNTYQDTDIIMINRRDGSEVNLTKHEGEAINRSPIPIDEKHFLYITNNGEEFTGIAIYDLEKNSWKYLVKEKWDVEDLDYRDGSIVYSVNEDGESVLKLFSFEKREPVEILRPGGVIDNIDFTREGVVLSINSPKHGPEIFITDLSGFLERVTYTPKIGVSEESFVSPKIFRYRSFDGLELSSLFYKPLRSFKEPPPAVLYLHGGPESQERVSFNRVHQVLLSLGIAIIAPNYRGSSGYGKSFIHLDDVDKRIATVYDSYHAVEFLAKKGEIDDKRLCVMGGSYGGYLTLMMLVTYPDLWRCGVEIVGIVNLLTFIKNTGAWRRRYRITEYGDPEIHRDIMIKLSPITYVDRIKAPLMVIHGAKDPRVPVSEAEQLVEALRGRGVDVRYIRLEDEGHGISKVRNRVRVYTEAVRFIYEKLSS
ncbi:acylamino-acid-releasing enzyme [Desulfurococcaceae archaeon AG1]|jgi:dipeptidyl aminopeptidase/acylaminoacyl peptidase|nr:MAG: S9 family peptidase [Desulfurococcaceae archaeon]GAY25021.1 acylamino-acid-releasing enzyme [Desulfurococcaceae archaeon AG1]